MCLAEPALVLSVDGDETAVVRQRGRVLRVPLIVVTSAGESVAPGDWLLVQTGLAVSRLTAAEAAQRIAFLQSGADHEQP